MIANDIKQAIKGRFPAQNQDGYHMKDRNEVIIDLDSPRSERIIAHYARWSHLGSTVVDHAIADLRRYNKKEGL